MINIFDHIQYLISRHDCVTVPRLGAFIAQRESARVCNNGFSILPPRRSLSFNSALTHDDGLLIGSVARREGLSYERAKDEVMQAVELLMLRLSSEGSVEIPRVGTVSEINPQSISFAPDCSEASIASVEFAGLLPVAVKPLKSEKQHIIEVDLIPESEIRVVSRPRAIVRRVARYAAAVALLVGLGITLSTPVVLDETNIVKASTAPDIKAPQTVTIPKITVSETIRPESETQIPVTDGSGQKKLKPDIINAADFDPENTGDYNCYIIVASCANQSEVNLFKKMHKSDADNLKVIVSDGRHRIYTAVASDYDKAFAFKSNDPRMKASYPDAWVYKAN